MQPLQALGLPAGRHHLPVRQAPAHHLVPRHLLAGSRQERDLGLQLGRQLGVKNSTAWLLRHWLLQAMQERDLGCKLRGTEQIDDAYLGGE